MATLDKIKLSGTTYDIVDSTALHSLDDNVTSGGTNAVKGSGIYNAITAATGALAETIAEQGYQTSGDVQNAISGKVDTTAFTAHTADTVAHTTQAEKNAWDAKLDANAVSGYADSVKYNSTSKYVEFYHGGTGGTKVFEYDASPFLIDGMVQNVEIKDVTISGESVTCLVISFNTDAGKQDINVPLTDIFDASNYYTKSEVDAELAKKANTATTYTKSEVDTALAAKANTADTYTKTATDNKIADYTYDKDTIDSKIAESGTFDPTLYYKKSETYSKTEVNTELAKKNDVISLDGTTLVIS